MLSDVITFAKDQDTEYIDEFTSTDADHGRIEKRLYRVYDVPEYWEETHNWPNLQTFVHVLTTRDLAGEISHCELFYLLSKRPTAEAAASLI